MESLSSLDSDCSALAGLFQIIINDLKNSGPMWDDFLSKASKLQSTLKTTLVVFSSFLDAFQKIADCATHTRGATKEVGAALTRLALRQRTIESKVKNLTNALMSSLIVPLQEKLEEWRKTQNALDKEHTKEYKRSRLEIKKRTDYVTRLQRKAKKSVRDSELNKLLDRSVDDLVSRYGVLEEREKTALRHALKEERLRYCTFALAMTPILDEQISLVSELGHLEEVKTQVEKHSSSPDTLPPDSEQVLEDIKSGDSKWRWKTPPSSPVSSLGSRKSSICSISSVSSSSSSLCVDSSLSRHCPRQRSVSQMMRHIASSASSRDSGFISQDTLHRPILMRPMSIALPKGSGLSENSCSDGQPTPCDSASTWPHNIIDATPHKSSSSNALHNDNRPHTISTAYEKGKERPGLNANTFDPPEDTRSVTPMTMTSQPVTPMSMTSQPVTPMSNESGGETIGQTATISRRSSKNSLVYNASSSQESIYSKFKPPLPNRAGSQDRPNVPAKGSHAQSLKQALKDKQLANSFVKPPQSSVIVPDFHKTAPDMIVPQPIYSNMNELKKIAAEQTENDCSSSLGSSSLGSSGYGSQSYTSGESQSNVTNADNQQKVDVLEYGRICMIRPHSLAIPEREIYDLENPSRGGSLRRERKPPPPVRRSSAVSTASISSRPSVGSNSSLNKAGATLHSAQSTPVDQKAQVIQSAQYGYIDHKPSNQSQLQGTHFPQCGDVETTPSVQPNGYFNSSLSNSSVQSYQPNSVLSNSSYNFKGPQQSNLTDSDSSTPIGSVESFPPPPDFILQSSGGSSQSIQSVPDGVSNRVILKSEEAKSDIVSEHKVGKLTEALQDCLQLRKISVSEAVKNLQETQHQPPSPVTLRKNPGSKISSQSSHINPESFRKTSPQSFHILQDSSRKFPVDLPQGQNEPDRNTGHNSVSRSNTLPYSRENNRPNENAYFRENNSPYHQSVRENSPYQSNYFKENYHSSYFNDNRSYQNNQFWESNRLEHESADPKENISPYQGVYSKESGCQNSSFMENNSHLIAHSNENSSMYKNTNSRENNSPYHQSNIPLSPRLKKMQISSQSIQNSLNTGSNKQEFDSSRVHLNKSLTIGRSTYLQYEDFKEKRDVRNPQVRNIKNSVSGNYLAPNSGTSPGSNSSSGRNSPIHPHVMKQNFNPDYFIQNLNMVIGQRMPGETAGVSPKSSQSDLNRFGSSPKNPLKLSPKVKKKLPIAIPNGASLTSNNGPNVQRSSSNVSEKTSKVFNWISSRKNQDSRNHDFQSRSHNSHSRNQDTGQVNPSAVRESLLGQIRRGVNLRRVKHPRDRSAPRVF